MTMQKKKKKDRGRHKERPTPIKSQAAAQFSVETMILLYVQSTQSRRRRFLLFLSTGKGFRISAIKTTFVSLQLQILSLSHTLCSVPRPPPPSVVALHLVPNWAGPTTPIWSTNTTNYLHTHRGGSCFGCGGRFARERERGRIRRKVVPQTVSLSFALCLVSKASHTQVLPGGPRRMCG